MEQLTVKEQYRECRRWRNDAIKWVYSAAESIGSTRKTALTLRNQIKDAACNYAEIGSQKDWEAACLLKSQMVDMLEEDLEKRM